MTTYFVSSVSINSTYHTILRDHLPVISNGSRRRLLISSSVRLPFLADGWPFVVTSSTAALACGHIESSICWPSRRCLDLLPLPSSPASITLQLSHWTTHPFLLHNNIYTYYSSYVLLSHCACLSLDFSLLLYNFHELSRITQYIYWRRTSAMLFPLTLVNISSRLHSNPCDICYSSYYCATILVKNTHLDTLSLNIFYHL